MIDPVVTALARRSVYLEIGGFRGGMLLHAAANWMPAGSTLISIDEPSGDGGGGNAAFDDLMRSAQIARAQGHDIHVIRGVSSDEEVLSRLRFILGGRAVNVLVIDGDHGLGSALADWQRFSPMLDGIAVWHDCGVQNGLVEVWPEAVQFMRHTRSGFDSAAVGHRFLTVQEDFGTGIIWKSSPDHR